MSGYIKNIGTSPTKVDASSQVKDKTMKQKQDLRSQTTTIFIPLLVEFLSMMFHTFWGSMGYHAPRPIAHNQTSSDDYQVNYLTTALVPAFQAGFAVWMLVVLWWKVCVAHFNPAVSIALLASGDFSFVMFVPYVVTQSLGSIFGAALAHSIRGGEDIGAFIIPEDGNIESIFAAEVMLTGMLCFFIVIQVGDKSYDQQTGPLAIGIAVFQGVLAGRWVGAGVMNPARALGPAVIIGGAAWRHHWVWWVADLVGGASFGLLYRCFFRPNDEAWLMRGVAKRERTLRENKKSGENEDMLIQSTL